jgi:hypothetical protein
VPDASLKLISVGGSSSSNLQMTSPLPAATPIPVIQAIGVNHCGVPAKELSPKKLLAALQEEEAKNEH